MSKYIIGLAIRACLLGECAMAETIEMVIGDKAYPVQLENHDAAKDFVKRLPMTLTFENFGSTERIAYLKNALTLGSAPRSTNPVTGDFAYYIPWGNVCVFVRDFRPSEELVPMGKFSAEATKAIKHSGDKPVTFRALQK